MQSHQSQVFRYLKCHGSDGPSRIPRPLPRVEAPSKYPRPACQDESRDALHRQAHRLDWTDRESFECRVRMAYRRQQSRNLRLGVRTALEEFPHRAVGRRLGLSLCHHQVELRPPLCPAEDQE